MQQQPVKQQQQLSVVSGLLLDIEIQYTGEHSLQCVESIMLVVLCPQSVLKI